MGLDQYCWAESSKRKTTEITGACGGLFPCAPDPGDRTELGYWRKAYNVHNLMYKVLRGYQEIRDAEGPWADVNCREVRMMPDEIEEILKTAQKKARRIRKDAWERQDWLKTVQVMKEAKQLLQEDPEAKIYYYIWY